MVALNVNNDVNLNRGKRRAVDGSLYQREGEWKLARVKLSRVMAHPSAITVFVKIVQPKGTSRRAIGYRLPSTHTGLIQSTGHRL